MLRVVFGKGTKMSEKKISKHDKVVLETGEFLSSKNGYNIYADRRHIGKEKWEGNGFKPPLELVAPCWLLSAFIPTKAIFSGKFALLDPDWKTPDLAVKRGDYTYVLDVLGKKIPLLL
jgi:hypothetical protein